MEQTITIQFPKKDVDTFLNVVDDIKFIKEAEKGVKEIENGKYKTLAHVRRKYGHA